MCTLVAFPCGSVSSGPACRLFPGRVVALAIYARGSARGVLTQASGIHCRQSTHTSLRSHDCPANQSVCILQSVDEHSHVNIQVLADGVQGV